MTDTPEDSAEEPETAPATFAEFLESVPPQQTRVISDAFSLARNPHTGKHQYDLAKPQLHLHCTSDSCNGHRFFRHAAGTATISYPAGASQIYLSYSCANCRKSFKTFALLVSVKEADAGEVFSAFKYGESPSYGPPVPTRLLRLFGADREIFLKGRRCENQGLGIGAFVYYRRVVEAHKDKILGEVIRVSQTIGAPQATIDALEAAKAEIQFSKAIEGIKDALPQSLLVNGRNPLTLLHSALSKGVHELSDEQCLELAHDIRVVLADLAERLGQALKDEAELNAAVNRLADNPKKKKG